MYVKLTCDVKSVALCAGCSWINGVPPSRRVVDGLRPRDEWACCEQCAAHVARYMLQNEAIHAKYTWITRARRGLIDGQSHSTESYRKYCRRTTHGRSALPISSDNSMPAVHR